MSCRYLLRQAWTGFESMTWPAKTQSAHLNGVDGAVGTGSVCLDDSTGISCRPEFVAHKCFDGENHNSSRSNVDDIDVKNACTSMNYITWYAYDIWYQISYHQIFMTSLFALPRIDPVLRSQLDNASSTIFSVSWLLCRIWDWTLRPMHPFKDFPVCGLLKRLARNPYNICMFLRKLPPRNGCFFIFFPSTSVLTSQTHPSRCKQGLAFATLIYYGKLLTCHVLLSIQHPQNLETSHSNSTKKM